MEYGPKSLLKSSPYDSEFNANVKRLSGKKQKEKHILKLEKAYQLAQKADLLSTDSMLNLENPDRWLYVNAYHRRLQGRQQKVLEMLPLESKNGYKPDFLFIDNIAEREAASRQAAASFLYQKGTGLLAAGTHAKAREAYTTLLNLKNNYYPVWENSAALIDSAAVAGVEHILLDGVCSPGFNIGNKWQKFYSNAGDYPKFDVIIKSHSLNVSVGFDNIHTTSYTESKDIEVGYTEKKDSNGVVIERSAIYEKISATVTETTIEKNASGQVFVEVLDGISRKSIYSTVLFASTTFSDKSVQVSGDRRALRSCVMETAGTLTPPSYWSMEEKVVDALNFDFRCLAVSRFWSDR